MSFGSPWWLLSLLAIPLLLAAAARLRRRDDRYAVRFPAADSLAQAASYGRSAWQYAPPVLLVLALTTLGLALARPERSVKVPIEGATVVLVTDHSGSMAATDVKPTRLKAATRAATSFLDATPRSARIGLVTYSDAVDRAIQPTRDHRAVREALEAQVANGATATGSALQVAVEMVRRQRSRGERPPAAIVLLSDGRTTAGPDPLLVAREAQALKVPISTVSLGTADATIPNPNNPAFPAIAVPPDPETLADIAGITGGRAFTTADADRLTSIYEELGSSLATKTQKQDMTEQFAAAGLLILLAAALASASLAGRVP